MSSAILKNITRIFFYVKSAENRNFQPGTEKNNIVIKKKECIKYYGCGQVIHVTLIVQENNLFSLQ